MNHRLLIFGDSWAYGAELDPNTRLQQNYGARLGELLNVDSVENIAESGSAISHLQVQFNNAITKFCDDIDKQRSRFTAVFFLTGQQRHLFFDVNGEFGCLSPSGPSIRPCQILQRDLFYEINDYYYKYVQSDSADVISLNTNLLALQARCRHYGIDDYYISGWEKLQLWPEVDASRIWKQGQSHCAELFGIEDLKFEQNIYIKPHGTHPNPQGHQLIADELYSLINQNNLTPRSK